MTSTSSAACFDTSHGLGPFSPTPSPSHTVPVNHSNFIDVTGITDETLSVSQLGVCVGPQSFCLHTDVHVHKYTVPTPPPPSPTLFSSLTIISFNQHTGKWNNGRHWGVCMCNWKSARFPDTCLTFKGSYCYIFLLFFKQRKGEVNSKSTLTAFLHQLMAL